MNRHSARLLESITERNSTSTEVCGTPRGKHNAGSPNTMEDRSTGGVALPAVPPATVRHPHTDSHRTGIRWNCKPELSNTQDFSVFTRRRTSMILSTIPPVIHTPFFVLSNENDISRSYSERRATRSRVKRAGHVLTLLIGPR
jgi:hypothetical protein